jgi:hypothetical protein
MASASASVIDLPVLLELLLMELDGLARVHVLGQQARTARDPF